MQGSPPPRRTKRLLLSPTRGSGVTDYKQINKAAKAGLRVWGFKLARDPFQTTVRGEAEYLLRERERSEIPPATLFDSRISVPKQGVRPSHVVRPLRMTPRAVDQPWDDAAALVRSCG
jgi:hypothetical protein